MASRRRLRLRDRLLDRRSPRDELSRLDRSAVAVPEALPGQATAIAGTTTAIESGQADAPLAPTHSDSKPGHILLAGDHVGLLDLDKSTLADPLVDVTHLLENLGRERGGSRRRGGQRAVRVFVEEYVSPAPAAWWVRLSAAPAFVLLSSATHAERTGGRAAGNDHPPPSRTDGVICRRQRRRTKASTGRRGGACRLSSTLFQIAGSSRSWAPVTTSPAARRRAGASWPPPRRGPPSDGPANRSSWAGHPGGSAPDVLPRADPAAADRFDLIVVGAGINGAGIARDAALRGLRTLLLDKGDVGGGTTSWSTRLIHGGLRYLEHGEVGLVRESLRERERLLRLAPHLVEPLPLLIPIYRGDRRGPWLVRAGMVAYDALSFDKSLDRHRMLDREAALARVPGLDPAGLQGAAVYYDAQVEYAERLAVENALAATARGATLLTYHRVDRLVVERGRVRGVVATDLLGSGEETVAFRAPVVVNVAGPWVDRVLAGLDAGPPPVRPLVGGTKGSHIVVGAFPGAPRDALYVEARRDGRPFFIVPWNDQYLIGTTDTRYLGDLDRVVADDDEIDYLLAETNRVVPGAGLGRADVHYSYAGVRPLPHRAAGIEGAITRRHLVLDHAEAGDGPVGLLSVVGGKLTTYRELAEQVADAVGRRLGRPFAPASTHQEPLPGGSLPNGGGFPAFRARFRRESGLPEASADHLLRVYGTRAAQVVAEAEADPSLRAPFDPASGAIAAEIPFVFRREGARTLTDALLRRTMVGLGPDAGVGADEAAAAVAQRCLGWDDARAAGEVAAYRAYVERFRPRSLPTVPSAAGEVPAPSAVTSPAPSAALIDR